MGHPIPPFPPFPPELWGSVLTLCRGWRLLCSPCLTRLLHPRPPWFGLGLQPWLLPLLLQLLPSGMELQSDASLKHPFPFPGTPCSCSAGSL